MIPKTLLVSEQFSPMLLLSVLFFYLSQVINITMALEEPNSVNQLIPATASNCPAFARSPTDQSPVSKNSAPKPPKLLPQHPLRTLWMNNVPAKWQSKYIFSIFGKKGISPKTIMRSAELEAGPPTRRIEFRTFADARRALSFNGKSAESQPEYIFDLTSAFDSFSRKEKEPIIADVIEMQNSIRTLWLKGVPFDWDPNMINIVFNRAGFLLVTISIMRSKAQTRMYGIEFETFEDAQLALSEMNGKIYPYDDSEILIKLSNPYDATPTKFAAWTTRSPGGSVLRDGHPVATWLTDVLGEVVRPSGRWALDVSRNPISDLGSLPEVCAPLFFFPLLEAIGAGEHVPVGGRNWLVTSLMELKAAHPALERLGKLQGLNSPQIGGRLTDTVSRQDALRTLWIRNLPPGWSITKISSYLEGEGFKLVSVIQPNYEKQVETHEEAKKAVAHLNETPVPNEESEVLFDTCLAFDCPGFAYILVIINLPDDCNVPDVAKAFKKYPSFVGVVVDRDSNGNLNGRAWLEFGDLKDWHSAHMEFSHLRIREFVRLQLRMDVKYAAHDQRKSLTPSPEQLTHFERKSITPAPIEHEIRKDRATYTPTSQYPLTPLVNDPQRHDSTPPNQANAEDRMSDDPWPQLLSTPYRIDPALERSVTSWLQACQAESERRMEGRSRPQITLALPTTEPKSPNESSVFPGPLNQSTPIKRTTDPSTAQHNEDPQPSISEVRAPQNRNSTVFRLIVSNLPVEITEDALCATFTEYPSFCGLSIELSPDGVSNTAIVTFGDRNECEVAYMVNRNAVLCSRKLGIHFDAVPVGTESNKALIPVADRSPETSLVPLDPHLRDYQPENDAAPLYNPSVLLRTEIPPFFRLIVSNLPVEITEDALCATFTEYPSFCGLSIELSPDGVSNTAIVTFGDRNECEVAYMVNRNAVLCSRKLGIHFDAVPVGTESNKALMRAFHAPLTMKHQFLVPPYFFSYGVACLPKLPEPCSQEGKEEVNKKKKVNKKVNFDDNVVVIPDVKKPRKVPARKKTITTPLKRNVPRKAQATPKKPAKNCRKKAQATPKKAQAAPKKGKAATDRKTATKKREDRTTVMKEKVVAEEEPLPAQPRRSSRHSAKNSK
ncbi:unnamed protein product [Caenorhabditis auriculariae]|uniref:RRM domain-containing protein n=1 Tax=Caenorhabditis auriculariae TaxID=2777116 RepID=A0A8S1HCR9_9PELO|nr:unnamed protein product [Caenorhabditis auriculariae]